MISRIYVGVILASHTIIRRSKRSSNRARSSWNFHRYVLDECLSERDLRRPQNRQRVRPKYAALSKCGHRTRRALAWGTIPLQRAVSIWKRDSKQLHGGLFRLS